MESDNMWVQNILQNLLLLVEKEKIVAWQLRENLELMLDNMLEDDGFGTEGQLDPRGDRRDL